MTLARIVSPQDFRTVLMGMLRVFDVGIVILVGVVMYALRHDHWDLPQIYMVATAFGGLMTANFMHFFGVYSFNLLKGFRVNLVKIIQGWATVVLSMIVIAYFTKTSADISRLWVAMWLVSALFFMIGTRFALRVITERWRRLGGLSTNILLVGAGDHLERLAALLVDRKDESVNVLGAFLSDGSNVTGGLSGVDVHGRIIDIKEYLDNHYVDEVIIALPLSSPDMLPIVRELSPYHCDITINPDVIGYSLPNLGTFDMFGATMIRVNERPITGWGHVWKRLEDVVVGGLSLIVSLPLMALIVLAIKIESPGPALFKQKRMGFRNDEFTIYKFRSMRLEEAPDASVPQATKDDPRITRVGRFLRRTSMDELPQLFNVVSGEMSLVGPRPHAVAHDMKYSQMINEYLGRHKTKPGITGWAQVNGLRGETDTLDKMQNRVQYDLYYIDHWSLLFDIRILLMTSVVCLGGKNAY